MVDYKTNWLGGIDGDPLTAWPLHGRTALDAGVMAGSDYPLQAMLYSVALHRFLRWRQPGYDQARTQIGGVLYLFVRGMCRTGNPAGGRQAVWRFRLAPARPTLIDRVVQPT